MSTLFLKIAVIVMGIPVIAIGVFILPHFVIFAFGHATDGKALDCQPSDILEYRSDEEIE